MPVLLCLKNICELNVLLWWIVVVVVVVVCWSRCVVVGQYGGDTLPFESWFLVVCQRIVVMVDMCCVEVVGRLLRC